MKEKRRGRKPNPNGEILSNGLFERQWKQIQEDAAKQGIDAAVLQRRIVDWYYAAKTQQAERQSGKYAQEVEFKKLSKKNKKENKE